MRLLFALPRFHTNLYYAMQALSARGHELMLCCEEQAPLEDHAGLRADLLQPRDLRWPAVFGRLRDFRPDVVVLRQYHGRWKRLCYAARLLAIPTLGYDQRPLCQPRSRRQRLREWLRGRPFHRMTPVLGTPGGPRDALAHYLPFPVQAQPGARSYAPDGVVRILCVGKLTQPRKQHFLLLRALEGLADAGAFRLSLVGSSVHKASGGDAAYYERLCEYVRSGPLAGRVALQANVPFRDMPALYREHDVCVLPSRDEPLGSAPLEAMAHGCVPVVSADCGSAGCIEPGRSGMVFPADDAGALQAILGDLLQRPERVAALGAAAAEHAARTLSPSLFAERFEALCRSLRS